MKCRGGRIKVPDQPRLGVQLDHEHVEKYADLSNVLLCIPMIVIPHAPVGTLWFRTQVGPILKNRVRFGL
jgi:hypothetical protein